MVEWGGRVGNKKPILCFIIRAKSWSRSTKTYKQFCLDPGKSKNIKTFIKIGRPFMKSLVKFPIRPESPWGK